MEERQQFRPVVGGKRARITSGFPSRQEEKQNIEAVAGNSQKHRKGKEKFKSDVCS